MLAQSMSSAGEKHPPTSLVAVRSAAELETSTHRDRGKSEGIHGPNHRPRVSTASAASAASAPANLDSLVLSSTPKRSSTSNLPPEPSSSPLSPSAPISAAGSHSLSTSPPSLSSSPTSSLTHLLSSSPASSTSTATAVLHRQRSGSDKEAGSPSLSRQRRDTVALLAASSLNGEDEQRVAALIQELPEESKEALRKKSEKLLKKELEKKMKEEERNSKKLKKKEQDEAKLSKKFQLPLEEVQKLINTYRCAYHKTGIIHHGKIYIFPNFLCFTSSSGLTTAKIAIADIQTITLKVINAIQIVTTPPDNPKGKKYYLSHWHHRERAFKAFNALWRHAQGDASINLEDLKDAVKLKTLSFDEGRTPNGFTTQFASGMSLESSADDFSITEDVQSDFDPPQLATAPAPVEEEENVILPPTLDNIQYQPPHASKSPDASAVLEVSLKRFWKLFFADPKFYSGVHLAKGDRVARTGEWSLSEGGFYTRPHYFEQDIKSKLMKGKICKVDQTQQACMRNPRQLVFGTDSRMEGVPYSSDFTVKTYWEITEEHPQLINIHVWLWVDWIKVPFGLKGTIERGSINGVKEHFESFIADTRTVLAARTEETNAVISGSLPSTADNSAGIASTPTQITIATPVPVSTANSGGSTVSTTINRVPAKPSTTPAQEKGLLETLFNDPVRAFAFGALLVALLAIFTYIFCSVRAGGPMETELPVLGNEPSQALVARWQSDLDRINDHLRQVHELMTRLQKEIQEQSSAGKPN